MRGGGRSSTYRGRCKLTAGYTANKRLLVKPLEPVAGSADDATVSSAKEDENQNVVVKAEQEGGSGKSLVAGTSRDKYHFIRKSQIPVAAVKGPSPPTSLPTAQVSASDKPVVRTVVATTDKPVVRTMAGDENCICLRPLKRVMCCVCGYYMEGRLRKLCNVHPRDVYLHDVTECPECGVGNDKNYLKEYEFPKSYIPTKTNKKIEA